MSGSAVIPKIFTNPDGSLTPQAIACLNKVAELFNTPKAGVLPATFITSAVVNAAITATAGAAYTGTEQAMLNNLKALVNQLRAQMIANGMAA